jgi:hypothetical protein
MANAGIPDAAARERHALRIQGEERHAIGNRHEGSRCGHGFLDSQRLPGKLHLFGGGVLDFEREARHRRSFEPPESECIGRSGDHGRVLERRIESDGHFFLACIDDSKASLAVTDGEFSFHVDITEEGRETFNGNRAAHEESTRDQ